MSSKVIYFGGAMLLLGLVMGFVIGVVSASPIWDRFNHLFGGRRAEDDRYDNPCWCEEVEE